MPLGRWSVKRYSKRTNKEVPMARFQNLISQSSAERAKERLEKSFMADQYTFVVARRD